MLQNYPYYAPIISSSALVCYKCTRKSYLDCSIRVSNTSAKLTNAAIVPLWYIDLQPLILSQGAENIIFHSQFCIM